MLLSRSLRRKLLATVLSAAALVLVYEATVIDSRTVPVQAAAGLPLVAGAKAEFVATAYCKGTTTRSGVNVRAGILAAELARELTDSLHLLMGLKLKAGLAEIDTGKPVSGGVAVDKLSSLERDLLKDALAVVKRFKTLVRHQFHLEGA